MNTESFKTIVQESLALLNGCDIVVSDETGLILEYEVLNSDVSKITISKTAKLGCTQPKVELLYWHKDSRRGYKSYYRFDSNGLFSDEEEVLTLIKNSDDRPGVL